MKERKKDRRRKKLLEVLPILSLYCRDEDPKGIAERLNKKKWWVYQKLSKVLRSL